MLMPGLFGGILVIICIRLNVLGLCSDFVLLADLLEHGGSGCEVP